MNHSNHHPPTQPQNGRYGNGHKISQRGLLSIAMLLVSVGALGFAMLGGAKMVLDILREEPSTAGAAAQVIVIVLAYAVGWATAILAIRVYGNLILPILISWFTWACLVAVCYLYIEILKRMYAQPDELGRFLKYLVVMAGGLGAMIGLHLIIEDHDLRPFAIPLLLISLIQLGLIVFRYVFDTESLKPGFLWKDLVFFFAMTAVAISMLAHLGLLEPIRKQITDYFDTNSNSIRTNH